MIGNPALIAETTARDEAGRHGARAAGETARRAFRHEAASAAGMEVGR